MFCGWNYGIEERGELVSSGVGLSYVMVRWEGEICKLFVYTG